MTRFPSSWNAWTNPSSSSKRNSSNSNTPGCPHSSMSTGMASRARFNASPWSRFVKSDSMGRIAAAVFGRCTSARRSSASSGGGVAAWLSSRGLVEVTGRPAWRMAQRKRVKKLREVAVHEELQRSGQSCPADSLAEVCRGAGASSDLDQRLQRPGAQSCLHQPLCPRDTPLVERAFGAA